MYSQPARSPQGRRQHRHSMEGSRRHQQSGICMLGPPYSTFGYWTDRQTSLLQRSPILPSPLIQCTRPVRHSAIWISSVRVQSRRSLCSFDKTLPRGWADSVGRQADRPTNCIPHPLFLFLWYDAGMGVGLCCFIAVHIDSAVRCRIRSFHTHLQHASSTTPSYCPPPSCPFTLPTRVIACCFPFRRHAYSRRLSSVQLLKTSGISCLSADPQRGSLAGVWLVRRPVWEDSSSMLGG